MVKSLETIGKRNEADIDEKIKHAELQSLGLVSYKKKCVDVVESLVTVGSDCGLSVYQSSKIFLIIIGLPSEVRIICGKFYKEKNATKEISFILPWM